MTPKEYQDGIEALGFSISAAGRWLGVAQKVASKYAKEGPSGPAAMALRLRLGITDALNRYEDAIEENGGEAKDADRARLVDDLDHLLISTDAKGAR